MIKALFSGPTSVVYPFAEPTSEIRKRNFGHLMESSEKILTVDDNGKVRASVESPSSASPPLEYQGVLKKTPSASVHGMRTMKSLSGRSSSFLHIQSHSRSSQDTISVQKKVVLGTDRLKRLDSSTSLFQRQTSLLTRKVSTLATKLVNPFVTIKKKIEQTPPPPTVTKVDSQIDLRRNMKRQISIVDTTDAPRRTVMISPLKRSRDDDEDDDQEEDDEPKERRRVQMLSVNQEIRRPTGLFSYEEQNDDDEEEPKRSTKTFFFQNKLIFLLFSYTCSNLG